jgi:hypothetical protein
MGLESNLSRDVFLTLAAMTLTHLFRGEFTSIAQRLFATFLQTMES